MKCPSSFLVLTLTLALCLEIQIHLAAQASSPQEPPPQVILEALSLLPGPSGEVDHFRGDWLIDQVPQKSSVRRGRRPNEITLGNGIAQREFRLWPNAATIALDQLVTGEGFLRAVKPEALLGIDGKQYAIGGLTGQPESAYLLPEWLDGMKSDPGAFQITRFRTGNTEPRLEWKRKRYSGESTWPPPGAALVLEFAPPAGLEGVEVAVHYEIFDGLPAISKWLTLRNGSAKPLRIDSFVCEILAAVETQSEVETPRRWDYPNLHVETDYSFGGMLPTSANRTVEWLPDPEHSSQVSYKRETPCLLECKPPIGPGVTVEPGGSFESFRVFELLHDSTDRERKGLAQKRLYRAIAPWATENPILMHVRDAKPEAVRLAIDQCAAVGFEMVILTFGSGFDPENERPEYAAGVKELVEYAHSKGIELGGYSLLASRAISDEDDVINPKTGKRGGAIYGSSPCLESRWGRDYFRKLQQFIERTGLDLLEHDGNYPGDLCASTSHPGHRGLDDSQWTQWRRITSFYRWCRGRSVYLNVPDWYFLQGSNKVGMGYRETNWSLPRDRQVILGRQNIFDGTWQKTPSMGWMFVPLVEYQGGGAEATLEPLSEHLDAYEAHLANNFGMGVQACYRGPRLYDAEATKAVVKRWVDFYKRHRAILDSDIVHLRRATGRDVDAILHVNPRIQERALLMVYNPLPERVERTLTLPLYFAGLKDKARLRVQDGETSVIPLDSERRATIQISVEPKSRTWAVLE